MKQYEQGKIETFNYKAIKDFIEGYNYLYSCKSDLTGMACVILSSLLESFETATELAYESDFFPAEDDDGDLIDTEDQLRDYLIQVGISNIIKGDGKG